MPATTAPTTGSAPTTAQLAATLSAIAYLGPVPVNELRRYEMNRALDKTAEGWQIVWGPVTAGEDLMYVAQNGSASQYALAVRGTLITRIENVIDDLAVATMVTPSFSLGSSFANAQISSGAQQVWNNLSAATPGPGLGKGTVLEFFQAVSGDYSLLVTGHSLGGQTAQLLAPWLAQALGTAAQVQLVTMAAPTAGDQAFAAGIDAAFGQSGTITGYYNTLDVVPMLWADLGAITSMYQGGPACGSLCKHAVDHMIKRLADKGIVYVQPTSREACAGSLYSISSINPLPFEAEVLDQHNAHYYMYFVGVQLGTIQQLDSKWEPPSSQTIAVG